MLSGVGSCLGCVCAGQRGCASFLFLAPLYIVEGLFKAPPLYRHEAFQAECLASLVASLGDRSVKRGRSLTTSGSLPVVKFDFFIL